MFELIGIILFFVIYLAATWNGVERKQIRNTYSQPGIYFNDIPKSKTKEQKKEADNYECLRHLLLYGHAGTGKTTFCELIHKKLCDKYGKEVTLHEKVAGQLGTPKAIETLVKEIKYGDVVFIDEIHSLPKRVEELLYSVMQDFVYHPIDDTISIGEYSLRLEGGEKSSKIKIPNFTLLGATTDAGSINTPLRDRFPLTLELEKQSVKNLTEIVSNFNAVKETKSFTHYTGQERAKRLAEMHINSLDKKPFEITNEASVILAEACLGIPRLANNFRYHAAARAGEQGKIKIDKEDAVYALKLLGIDNNGLTPLDRRLIEFLLERDNQAVGVAALAAVCGCSQSDIKEMVVPRMSYAKMLTRNNRSMLVLTKKAIEYYKEAAYDKPI